ncbi:hypothetical protein EVAR_17886_1 [Eumeta japonica]|uniref:Uncharacterized protein n=1 Tax=Eumeta variegata TaxID=151549 RepID=A0A4C1UY62_EUMVA|nr:hypothetical protein EVAR_17886_1 [Eumeta japonica]
MGAKATAFVAHGIFGKCVVDAIPGQVPTRVVLWSRLNPEAPASGDRSTELSCGAENFTKRILCSVSMKRRRRENGFWGRAE